MLHLHYKFYVPKYLTKPLQETEKQTTQENASPAEPTLAETIKKISDFLKPVFADMWKNRWKIIAIDVVILVLVALYLFFGLKNFYVSTVTIIPEIGTSRSSMGGLGDLAALAGISVGGGGDAPTEIYQYLITTESILLPVAYKKYPAPKDLDFTRDSINLFEYYEIEVDDTAKYTTEEIRRLKQIKVVEELSEKVATSLEKKTKILDLSVETYNSHLSSLVANEIIKSLDDYVVNRRKSNAQQNRIYLEKRTSQVKDSLTVIEDILANFRDRNRVVVSPNLILEQGRLMRALEIQQGIYVELTKQLELAKMQEIKDTPVISIREQAKESVLKSGPVRSKLVLIALFLLVFVNTSWFLLKSFDFGLFVKNK